MLVKATVAAAIESTTCNDCFRMRKAIRNEEGAELRVAEMSYTAESQYESHLLLI